MIASRATLDVIAERRRQISAEGWTAEHDDEHADGSLAVAAATYAYEAGRVSKGGIPSSWPWSAEWWKPRGARENLVRAAALIIAEIERLDRRGEQITTESATNRAALALSRSVPIKASRRLL